MLPNKKCAINIPFPNFTFVDVVYNILYNDGECPLSDKLFDENMLYSPLHYVQSRKVIIATTLLWTSSEIKKNMN